MGVTADAIVWTPPETWLVVREVDGGVVSVDAREEQRIDAAVTLYRDSGRTRDEWLSLTMVEGEQYRVLASRIGSCWLCTPKHRRRNLMRVQAQQEEDKALRADLGLPWEES